MSTIFGLAGLSATDYQFMNQVNAELIYSAVQEYLMMADKAMMGAEALFVETQTINFKERYQLPMSGKMQEVSTGAKAAATKRLGSYDVAYPLKQYADDLVTDRIDYAYMSPAEFQSHIDGIVTRSRNTRRHEILRRIFKNTTDTFTDRRWGSLTIQPLANNDSVTYPPVEGSETEAAENHYSISGYVTANISDTNNPIPTLTNELVEHSGVMTGDVPVITLCNAAETPYLTALTSFIPWTASAVTPGANTDTISAPSKTPPGRLLGYFPGGSWLAEWAWIPATYLVSVHLDAPAPLKMRIDPPETGLSDRGVLQLTGSLSDYPLTFSEWSLRFGLGAGNRLSAAVMELDTVSYTIPTIYQT